MAPSLPGDGVNVTAQAPEESVQEAPDPKAPDMELNVTVPVGVIEVPTPVESETFAVHVVGALTGTVAGEHCSDVELSRWSTLSTAVPKLDP